LTCDRLSHPFNTNEPVAFIPSHLQISFVSFDTNKILIDCEPLMQTLFIYEDSVLAFISLFQEMWKGRSVER